MIKSLIFFQLVLLIPMYIDVLAFVIIYAAFDYNIYSKYHKILTCSLCSALYLWNNEHISSRIVLVIFIIIVYHFQQSPAYTQNVSHLPCHTSWGSEWISVLSVCILSNKKITIKGSAGWMCINALAFFSFLFMMKYLWHVSINLKLW